MNVENRLAEHPLSGLHPLVQLVAYVAVYAGLIFWFIGALQMYAFVSHGDVAADWRTSVFGFIGSYVVYWIASRFTSDRNRATP